MIDYPTEMIAVVTWNKGRGRLHSLHKSLDRAKEIRTFVRQALGRVSVTVEKVTIEINNLSIEE